MKFISSGLKDKQSIVIDGESEDSDIESDKSEGENHGHHKMNCLKEAHRHPGHKLWKITPIGRSVPSKPKPHLTHKIE